MDGSSRRGAPARRRLLGWLAPAATALALGLAGTACDDADGTSDGGGGGGGDSFDRNALLAHIGEDTVLPAYRAFAAKTAELVQAALAYESAVKGGGGDPAATLATLRQRWEEAIDIWEECELYQFGPASGQSGIVGAFGLRDQVYSWSTVNPCRIDRELVGGAPYVIANQIVTFGLDALEYLIARADGTLPPDENACPPTESINQGSPTPFESLVANGDQLTVRRAEYMTEVAARLDGDAIELRDLWEPAVGDFLGRFANAGQAGSGYASAQVAIDDVFAGMFYLDFVAKDQKLADPAGISATPGVPTPDLVESPFLDRSKRHLVANLRAFQRLFLGNAPGEPAALGFDDFLAERGASELAIELENKIAAALAAAEAIDLPGEANGTLRAAIVDAGDGSELAAHAAVKEVTDLLKTQFITVLNLRVPDQGAGDGD